MHQMRSDPTAGEETTRSARSSPVRRYYDTSTRLFTVLGHGRRSRTIHRAVWGPGVADREDAMHFVHTLILDELVDAGADRFLDLGCGVGGSLSYLLRRTSGSSAYE